jgi:hypothetical protein
VTTAWCIQHRDGWCATKDGAEPSEDAWKDPTACGYVVTMRGGSEIREPDCEECRAALSAEGATDR